MESGSLSGAARRLGATQPTVGRHIAALEEALGAALFTRSPGGLAPTEAALALKPHAEAMADAAEALIRTASGEAASEGGVIRLTASEIVGAEVLPPLIATFRERHPDIVIELVLSNRQEDLLRREADIAVRMARPTQAALVARRIGQVRVFFYAHRRYLAAHGTPARFSDLQHHALIGFDRDAAVLESLRATGVDARREQFAVRTDSDLAQLALLRAGAGISACQPGIAGPDLVQILSDEFHFDLEVWVAMHEDLRATRRMRLMFDFLAEGLSAYVAKSWS